jgi:hypothetical protein
MPVLSSGYNVPQQINQSAEILGTALKASQEDRNETCICTLNIVNGSCFCMMVY